MMPNLNSKQVQKMMRSMGISQDELEVSKIIMETSQGTLIFENPQVSKMTMSGQDTYQIVGTPIQEEQVIKITNDDIQTVMEQANVSRDDAIQAIQDANGDLAQAILTLAER
ncbi:MAG: nascent polypeptide-associated complex protein [Candidatus Woesearchaeota archaeon]